MGLTSENKDGVTLIAEAIRKEKQAKMEASALKQVGAPNVSDVTAQFSHKPTQKAIVEGSEGATGKEEAPAEDKASESTETNNND